MRELKEPASALSQLYSYSSLVLWTVIHLFITAKYGSTLLTTSLETTFSDINGQILDFRPFETPYYVTYEFSKNLYR